MFGQRNVSAATRRYSTVAQVEITIGGYWRRRSGGLLWNRGMWKVENQSTHMGCDVSILYRTRLIPELRAHPSSSCVTQALPLLHHAQHAPRSPRQPKITLPAVAGIMTRTMAFFVAFIVTVHAATLESQSDYQTCVNDPTSCVQVCVQRSPASQVPMHAMQGAIAHDRAHSPHMGALYGNTLQRRWSS